MSSKKFAEIFGKRGIAQSLELCISGNLIFRKLKVFNSEFCKFMNLCNNNAERLLTNYRNN